jgi:hypothetical protein
MPSGFINVNSQWWNICRCFRQSTTKYVLVLLHQLNQLSPQRYTASNNNAVQNILLLYILLFRKISLLFSILKHIWNSLVYLLLQINRIVVVYTVLRGLTFFRIIIFRFFHIWLQTKFSKQTFLLLVDLGLDVTCFFLISTCYLHLLLLIILESITLLLY